MLNYHYYMFLNSVWAFSNSSIDIPSVYYFLILLFVSITFSLGISKSSLMLAYILWLPSESYSILRRHSWKQTSVFSWIFMEYIVGFTSYNSLHSSPGSTSTSLRATSTYSGTPLRFMTQTPLVSSARNASIPSKYYFSPITSVKNPQSYP